MDENKNPIETTPTRDTSPLQPTLTTNGQPDHPTTSVSHAESRQASDHKQAMWRYLFIALGLLQVVGVCLFVSEMLSITGKTGSEFIALLLYAYLVPAIGIAAFISLVGSPIYMAKYKSHGKGLIVGIIALLFSTILVLYAGHSTYQIYVVAPNHMRERAEQLTKESKQYAQEFATANEKPEITKEKAIELLKTCQLKGFYYTNQTKPEEHQGIQLPAAETSSTGVVLVMVNGNPLRISIADRLISELVPIAREAQKTCVSLQFWHDGAYEQYKDGKWYFGNEVVNTI